MTVTNAITPPASNRSSSTARYRGNPAAIRALVRETEVHRDLFIDEELYGLEMEHLFTATWLYVGHASQVPNAGDFITTTLGDQPVVVIRGDDGAIRVLHNRCAHKGVQVLTEPSGNAGRFLRCPYHAWAYNLDGTLRAIPLRSGYDAGGLAGCEAEQGMAPVRAVQVYREFVFARLGPQGMDFETFFGASLSTIDNMVDRAPAGRLLVEGGVLRYLHRCNWKMLVDNQTDAAHPMVAHESSAGTVVRLWKGMPEGTPKPMAVEQFSPFVNSYDFFDGMGIRTWPHGHGHTGVSDSIHAGYSAVGGYWEAMVAAHGEARAKQILGEVRHNTVYFPNIMVKGPIQTLRVFRPLAADRTLVESWTFRLVGAPEELLARTLTYNRLINAPTSMVGHDDLEVYERSQAGLHSRGAQWVHVGRFWKPGEDIDASVAVVSGTDERQIRNQYQAWARFMTESMGESREGASV